MEIQIVVGWVILAVCELLLPFAGVIVGEKYWMPALTALYSLHIILSWVAFLRYARFEGTYYDDLENEKTRPFIIGGAIYGASALVSSAAYIVIVREGVSDMSGPKFYMDISASGVFVGLLGALVLLGLAPIIWLGKKMMRL